MSRRLLQVPSDREQGRTGGRARVRGVRYLALAACGCALMACSGGTEASSPAANSAAGGAAAGSGNAGGTGEPANPTTQQPVEGQPAAGAGAPTGSESTAGAPVAGTPTGEPNAPNDGPAATVDCSTPDVSPKVLARLSRLEYQLTLKELFQLPDVPAVPSVPQDSDFKGFRTVAALQNVTTEHLRSYQEEATVLAEALLADATRARAVIGCDVAEAGCLSSFISDFGRVAYRRDLSDDDIAALMGVAERAEGGPEQQFVDVVTAMLSSPSFLFRMELGDSPDGLSTLDGEELASKLSFALTGRGPSRELLDRGAAGEFDTETGLADVAAELLTDARSQEFFDAFFEQWLGFEQLRRPNEPGPDWDDSLMPSMKDETHRFLAEYAWAPGVNFLDALTANHTYIGDDLAAFYDLPAPGADGRVEFPADHNRANSGLLTHAALISAKGDGDKIAHRGAWIQKVFLCVELEVPTALLDSLSTELEGLTYPAMLEKRNTDAACAGCHALIDPIGMGFYPYDAAGQFNPEADIYEYGITPALPGEGGGNFETLGGLATLLRARPELSECLTDRVFLYAEGREAGAADSCTVSHAAEQFDQNQGRFASILEGLVLAPEFRLRRAPEAASN